jgi:hypothetical protein
MGIIMKDATVHTIRENSDPGSRIRMTESPQYGCSNDQITELFGSDDEYACRIFTHDNQEADSGAICVSPKQTGQSTA